MSKTNPTYMLIKYSDEIKDNILLTQTIRVSLREKTEEIDYFFAKPSPHCSDGCIDEMCEQLKERGWGTLLTLSFKENLSVNGLLDCFAFRTAYTKVYQEKVPDEDIGIDLSVSEFLDLVDMETDKIRNEFNKKYQNFTGVIELAADFGFEFF